MRPSGPLPGAAGAADRDGRGPGCLCRRREGPQPQAAGNGQALPGGLQEGPGCPPGLAHCGLLTPRTLRGLARALAGTGHRAVRTSGVLSAPNQGSDQRAESQTTGAPAVPLGDSCPRGLWQLQCPGSRRTGPPSLYKVGPGTPQMAGPPPGTGALDSETTAGHLALPAMPSRAWFPPRRGPRAPSSPALSGHSGEETHPTQGKPTLSCSPRRSCHAPSGAALRNSRARAPRKMPVALHCPQLTYVPRVLAAPKHATPLEQVTSAPGLGWVPREPAGAEVSAELGQAVPQGARPEAVTHRVSSPSRPTPPRKPARRQKPPTTSPLWSPRRTRRRAEPWGSCRGSTQGPPSRAFPTNPTQALSPEVCAPTIRGPVPSPLRTPKHPPPESGCCAVS